MAKETSKREDAQSGEMVVTLPLSVIEFDSAWNARTKLDVTEVPGEDSWEDFKASLALGQKTPIVVRPHPKTGSRYKYKAVAGHRRGEAIRQNADAVGNKGPTILALVREMSEQEALELNLLENTARQNLSGPDLAVAVGRLKASSPKLTETEIAQKIGKSQPYVHKMLEAYEKLTASNPQILQAWKNGTEVGGNKAVSAGINKIVTIAKKKPEEQIEAYNGLASVTASTTTGGPDKWAERVQAECRVFGEMIGRLKKLGALNIEDDFFSKRLMQFEPYVRIPETAGRLKQAPTDEQMASFAKKAHDAYTEALTKPEPGPKLVAPKAAKKAPKDASAN